MSASENLPPTTDEELLRRHLAGQKPAFAELVRRYQRELFHFLVRFLGNRAAAEDVFQEAFLQVYESAATFDLSRRFRPWLFTIAANKARDAIRSKQRHPAAPLDTTITSDSDTPFVDLLQAAGSVPEEALKQVELRQTIQHTIQQLPPHLKEILLLGYFHEFSYKQIGEMLKIPVGTVKSRLHAAVGHFATRWGERPENH
jgi:RNA polymerase sigma-70 factor, ECF subfamily